MMPNKNFLLVLGLWACAAGLFAQPSFPVSGVYDFREGLYAFTNATIVQRYDRSLSNATLVVRDGLVEACGAGVAVPAGAVVFDLAGHHIYPSFVEPFADYGMPEAPKGRGGGRSPQEDSNKSGPYAWNQALNSEASAAAVFKVDPKAAGQWRELGFGAVLTHLPDGISRGASALVSTATDREQLVVLKGEVAHQLSFNKGSSQQSYPSSLMGAIALLRQTYLDAEWYARQGQKEEYNLSLARWNALKGLPQVFAVRDKLEALRAAKLGQEFGLRYVIMGRGDEYQRLDALKTSGSAFIVPLDFPAAFDVEDPFDAMQLELADMKHWEMAPANAAYLAKAGIPFAFSTQGLKDKKDFLPNVRKAIRYGLDKTEALKALTFAPAQLLGFGDLLGSLEQGRVANFLICTGDIFDDRTQILQHWVQGRGHILQSQAKGQNLAMPNAVYELSVGGARFYLNVGGPADNPRYFVQAQLEDSTEWNSSLEREGELLQLGFDVPGEGRYRLSGSLSGANAQGYGFAPDGQYVAWSASPIRSLPKQNEPAKAKSPGPAPQLGPIPYPFHAYGWTERPAQENILFRNATVWTNEAEGILPKADVLVRDGRIAQVGQNLSAAGARVVDAEGKHLSSGIIDEHSHIAISRGVNEGSQYSTAEVRIGDVLNSEDVNIYRQLAGGVTAAQLLHGSANPIGGQSALIKLRWGWAPEEMKIDGADGFIKFALGENVKQSNWGDDYRSRFPQTRMGVEQVFADHFTRALDYEALKRSGKPYRKDLEMEAILEIVRRQRFISCHSYVQSEIVMLMRVAEQFGFQVNTFTHILEGYKVADKMAAHGAGGSTFSDWWAYKYEVIDAIPHNAAIMHEQGVVVAINSDDAEMARRLNQEAAKAVKYGGMSEEEAWKTVTLNPAKLLHLDGRMGSIKVGKDADLVLWSGHPMSIYSRAEMTLVDGRVLFSIEADRAQRQAIAAERERLIQAMLAEKKGGGKTQPARGQERHLYHCDDIENEIGEE